MKRVAFILLTCMPFVHFGQTIVSTEPQNKNVVLEQFTGVNCGYCPDGTIRSRAIYDANPTRVVLIAVHAGGYSNPTAGQPDFRTPFGNTIAGQTGLTGYPAGTVNRHVFPGLEMTSGSTAMDRGKWANAAGQIMAQASYVNVGATAEIDLDTRLLTVYVEAYYTGTSALGTNKINVVLLQDRTYGYQANGGTNYEHNNRMVHMLTGQWGSDIPQTTVGSLYSKSFTYTIPANYNQIPVALENMRVAVFVAESNQEIISGVQVSPTYLNVPNAFEYSVVGHSITPDVWYGSISPSFRVRTTGASMTSLDIQYKVNDEPFQNYSWEGNVTYGQFFTIALPEISFLAKPQNTVTINILNEDNTPSNNSITAQVTRAPAVDAQNLIVQVRTDAWGTEVTWNIKNEAGEIVVSGGPYADNSTVQTPVSVTLPLGNYTLNALDLFGDGNPGGYINIVNGTTTFIGISGNSYSFASAKKFRVVTPVYVQFDPANEAIDIDGDGPFVIIADKNLYTGTFAVLDNTTALTAVRLKENSASGADIPFTATVIDQKMITIVPNSQIATDQVVYMAYVGLDEDALVINQSVTFTVKNTVSINGLDSNGIGVYPNPTQSHFNVVGAENSVVTIYNLAGQQIMEQIIENNNTRIALPDAVNGVLVVKILKNGEIVTKSLVVMP